MFHGPFPWLLVACSILVVPVRVAANLIFFSLIGEERRWENFLTNDMRWTKADTENVYIGVGGQMKKYISLVFISWTEGRHTGDDV